MIGKNLQTKVDELQEKHEVGVADLKEEHSLTFEKAEKDKEEFIDNIQQRHELDIEKGKCDREEIYRFKRSPHQIEG